MRSHHPSHSAPPRRAWGSPPATARSKAAHRRERQRRTPPQNQSAPLTLSPSAACPAGRKARLPTPALLFCHCPCRLCARRRLFCSSHNFSGAAPRAPGKRWKGARAGVKGGGGRAKPHPKLFSNAPLRLLLLLLCKISRVGQGDQLHSKASTPLGCPWGPSQPACLPARLPACAQAPRGQRSALEAVLSARPTGPPLAGREGATSAGEGPAWPFAPQQPSQQFALPASPRLETASPLGSGWGLGAPRNPQLQAGPPS